MSTAIKQSKFRTGGASAEAADAEARKASGNFARVTYFSLDDGKKVVVRMLTESDDWVYVGQHQGVKTKNKPAGYTGKWPESLPAVCRYTEVRNPDFQNPDDDDDPRNWVKMHPDCYVCDNKLENSWGRLNKPSLRVWALAALREEVLWTEEDAAAGECEAKQVGRVRGYKDAMRQVTIPAREAKDGQPARAEETKTEIAIVVMNQAFGNFFTSLQSAYNAIESTTGEGTVLDRDFIVSRKGEKKDSEYHFFPLDPTPNLKPGTERWERYEKAIEEQNLDLQTIVDDKASDEFYARFFDPTKEAPAREGSKDSSGAPAAQQDAAPTNEVDPDALAAMRDRVRSGKTSSDEID